MWLSTHTWSPRSFMETPTLSIEQRTRKIFYCHSSHSMQTMWQHIKESVRRKDNSDMLFSSLEKLQIIEFFQIQVCKIYICALIGLICGLRCYKNTQNSAESATPVSQLNESDFNPSLSLQIAGINQPEGETTQVQSDKQQKT